MAEKKIVSAKSVSKDKKNTGLSIDSSELKKIGAAILAFVASNPELIGKLLEKPASYLKKIVSGEDVSSSTKKTVKKTIDNSKSGGITSILTSLSGLSDGDKETNSIFDNISSTLSKTQNSGIDVGSLVGGLLNSGNTTKKKGSKSKSSNNVFGNILKGLFK